MVPNWIIRQGDGVTFADGGKTRRFGVLVREIGVPRGGGLREITQYVRYAGGEHAVAIAIRKRKLPSPQDSNLGPMVKKVLRGVNFDYCECFTVPTTSCTKRLIS